MRRRTPIDQRQRFTVEGGWLVRTVRTTQGGTYRHCCSLAAYQAVCWFIEEQVNEGVTSNLLWQALPDVPCTQAAVAVAFLKERGCLNVSGRRFFPSSGFFFEDALIEFHALVEETGD